MTMYDTIVIGSGAAGLTAGMYAARYQLNTLIIGKELGGETTTAWTIENYPGFTSIDGFELVQKMKEQVEKNGVSIVDKEVIKVERTSHCFNVHVSNSQYSAKTIIFANGTLRRHLNLPNEKALTGKGVHYCATCDAPLYKDKVIAIVGGGDASVKGANLAKSYASKVYLLVRGDKLTGEPHNIAALEGTSTVEVLYNTEVTTIVGQQKLEKVTLAQPYNNSNELMVDGLFIEIGADPNVALPKQLGVNLDERGYIQVDALMRTNIDGVFAAGDSTNHFGAFKQVITAAAQGAVAATSAFQDVSEHGQACEFHAVVTTHRDEVI